MGKEKIGNIKKGSHCDLCMQRKEKFDELSEWLKNIRKRKNETEYCFLNNKKQMCL